MIVGRSSSRSCTASRAARRRATSPRRGSAWRQGVAVRAAVCFGQLWGEPAALRERAAELARERGLRVAAGAVRGELASRRGALRSGMRGSSRVRRIAFRPFEFQASHSAAAGQFYAFLCGASGVAQRVAAPRFPDYEPTVRSFLAQLTKRYGERPLICSRPSGSATRKPSRHRPARRADCFARASGRAAAWRCSRRTGPTGSCGGSPLRGSAQCWCAQHLLQAARARLVLRHSDAAALITVARFPLRNDYPQRLEACSPGLAGHRAARSTHARFRTCATCSLGRRRARAQVESSRSPRSSGPPTPRPRSATLPRRGGSLRHAPPIRCW